MERIPVDWLMEIPPVTRCYLVGVVGLSLLEYTGLISRSTCYYSVEAVFKKKQYYRLISSFFYFGTFSFDLIFTLYIVTRYSKALEQSYTRSVDYLWCLFVLGVMIIIYSSFVGNLYLLGTYLNDTLLYIWSRRNPDVDMTILGLVNFKSIYLPVVSVLLSRLATSGFKLNWRSELAGILIGQVFIFFNDIFPRVHCCHSPLRPVWYWFIPEQVEQAEAIEGDANEQNHGEGEAAEENQGAAQPAVEENQDAEQPAAEEPAVEEQPLADQEDVPQIRHRQPF